MTSRRRFLAALPLLPAAAVAAVQSVPVAVAPVAVAGNKMVPYWIETVCVERYYTDSYLAARRKLRLQFPDPVIEELPPI